MRASTTTRLALGLVAGLAFFGSAHPRQAWGQAAPGVTLGGLVAHPQQLAPAELRAMSATTLTVTFNTEHGVTKADWTGVPLWAVIQHVGLSPAVTGNRQTMLQHSVLAKGRDGYSVLFSIGELDPRFGASQALLVYARDGKPLPDDGLRLVVPGDKMGGRAVQQLTELDVQ